MHPRAGKPIAVLVLALGLTACGASKEASQPAQWLGVTPHLQVKGVLSREQVDIDVSGPAAADTTKLWCERHYQISTSGGKKKGKLSKLTLNAIVPIAGQSRHLVMDIEGVDLQRTLAGNGVTVVPRLRTSPLQTGQTWLTWYWFINDATGAMLFAESAQQGVFTLGEFTGTPGSDGLIIPNNQGSVGGHLFARWSEYDALEMSFTAKCALSIVEQID